MANQMIYTQISTLCAQRDITPSKLCSDLGISRGIITDLKAGRKKDIYATTAWKIANYFGVSVGYLLGLEDK
jgi:transcriptional regulator with XRE-family HTH domain